MAATSRLRVTFVVTPRFDLFYALYALADKSHSPLDEWKARTQKRLPVRFKSTAEEVAPRPIFWPLFADTLQQARGELSFEEIVSALRLLPAAEVRSSILSGIFQEPATVASLIDGKRSLRQILEGAVPPGGSLLAHFGLSPYDAASPATHTISRLLTHPAAFRDNLVTVLQEFWQKAFRSEWERLETDLNAEVMRMRELEAQLSLEDLMQQLRLPVIFDGQGRAVRPRQSAPIPYDRIDQCFVLPSAFNARRWWAKYETRAGRVDLYFPVLREAASQIAPLHSETRERDSGEGRALRTKIKAELVFRALGDTTRYAIASILARTPTTSAELARRLGVSKPTITHHIQTLRSAGLINEASSSGPTKLSLNRDVLASLSRAALDQLFSGSGELPLDTTRKRRTP
jgi:DNA-binding transcriptional ArsR family regulator